MKKSFKIYVDDVRQVPEGYFGTKSVNETIRVIEMLESDGHEIELIDLDHDLGDYEKDGGDAINILDFLVQRGTLYPVTIHSSNVVGRANMERIIERFWHQ